MTELKRSKQEWVRRYVSFIFILFVIAFGTSLSIRANLGSSPISAPPYVLSVVPGIRFSMGQMVIMMHVLFILFQIVLLRRDYELRQLSQIGVSLLFGVYTDLTMWMTSFVQVPIDINPFIGYPVRFVELLIGGLFLAFGIAAEVRCDSLMLAGEGLPLAISRAIKADFGKVKICSDTGLVAIGVIFMLVNFGYWDWKLIGVGSLVSMFYVGFMVRVLSPHVSWLDVVFIPKEERTGEREIDLPISKHEHLVVTIAREYGSDGIVIGEKVAEKLGIPCYNRQLIDLTAEKLGYERDYVAESEQNIPNSKLWELIFTDKSIPPSMNPSEDDAIFVSQSRTIREIANQGPCVIVGRLANWILRDNPNTFRVFISSDREKTVERVMKREDLSGEEASRRIVRINEGRANHYWQYTGGQWTDPHNYDLMLNRDRVGIDGGADIILRVLDSIGLRK